MKKLLILPLFIFSLMAKGQYDPSKATVTNKPLGIAQAVPTDARSYYYSPSLFIWRPYQSTAEVLSTLNIAKYRIGHFPIYVNEGGALQSNGSFVGGAIKEYWFRNGVTNSDLVLKTVTNTAGTLAEMRALTSSVTGQIFTLTDYGGGTWINRGLNDGVHADNTGTIVIDASGHWWERQFSGAANVLWFGVKGDGIANDLTGLQAAVDFVIGGNVANGASSVRKAKCALFIPTGKYRITAPLKVYSVEFLHLFGDVNSEIYVDANMQTAVDLNGLSYSTVENLKITSSPNVIVDYGMFTHWNSNTAIRSSTQNTFRNIFILDCRYKTGFKIGNITGVGVQVDNSDYYHIQVAGQWTSETETIETTLWQRGIEVGDGTFGNNVIHNFFYLVSSGNRDGLFVNASQAAVHTGAFDLAENSILLLSSGYFYAQGIRIEHSQRLLKTSTTGNIPCVARLSDIDYHGEFVHPDGNWIYYTLGGSLILDNVTARELGGFSGTTQAKVFLYALQTSLNVRGLNVQSKAFPTGIPIEQAFDLASTVDATITGYSSLDSLGNPVLKQKGTLQYSNGVSSYLVVGREIEHMMVDDSAFTTGSLRVGFEGAPQSYYTDIKHRVVEAGHIATDLVVKNSTSAGITALSIDNITGASSFGNRVSASNGTQSNDLTTKFQLDSLRNRIISKDDLSGRFASDANTINENDFYYLGGTNRPAGVVDGTIINYQYNSSYQVQLFGDWRTGNFYSRGKAGGSFNAWRRLAMITDLTDSLDAREAVNTFILRNAGGTGDTLMSNPSTSTAIMKRLTINGASVVKTDTTLTYTVNAPLNGTVSFTGNGSSTSFTIPLSVAGMSASSKIFLTAKTAIGAALNWVDVSDESITVYYLTAPTSGVKTLNYMIIP